MLLKIQEQDPTITSVFLLGDDSSDDIEQPRELADLVDWEAVGRAIGEIRFIKSLMLDNLCHGKDFRSNFVPFLKGLADNRSIEMLTFCCTIMGTPRRPVKPSILC